MLKRKIRRLSSLLASGLIACALLLPASPVLAAGVNMYISPTTQTVDPGDSFNVVVMIDTDTQTRGAQCDVSFDPSLVHVGSVTEGTFYSSWASSNGGGTYWQPPTVDNVAGTITGAAVAVTGAPGAGPTGTRDFIEIQMTALTGVDGTSAITLANALIGDIDGDPLSFDVEDGEVIVGTPSGPDLVVTDKYEEWVNESAGTYNVTYTIANQGTETAGASTTEVSIDGTNSTTASCPSLPAGDSDTGTVGPFTISDAEDVITVTADINDDVAESNEGNNSMQNTLLPGKMIVEGPLAGDLVVTVPDSILDWGLEVGENTEDGTLNVKCNTDWQVTVSDDDVTTAGHMKEWDGAAYGSELLDEQMFVECPAQGNTVGLETSGVIATGDVSGQQQGNAGEDVDLTFNQTIEYDDPKLPDGSVYRIVITFTGAMTF
jgi:hypothetical protein